MSLRLRSEHWRILLVHKDKTPPQGVKRIIPVTYRGKHLHQKDTTGFFRGKNRDGYHIYGRPDTTQYVLLDDVCIDDMDAIRADNINISVAVETSPHNYQAWIKVARNPISRAEALICSRILAERYNGDKGAVSSMQLGRFPGATLKCYQAGQEIVHEHGLKDLNINENGLSAWRLDGSRFTLMTFKDGGDMFCTIINRKEQE